jgi:hypothetical protein
LTPVNELIFRVHQQCVEKGCKQGYLVCHSSDRASYLGFEYPQRYSVKECPEQDEYDLPEVVEWFQEVPSLSVVPGNRYSQFGEDGVLKHLFAQIGTTNKAAFEFGAMDGMTISNTCQFWEQGWYTYLIEADKGHFERIKFTERCTKRHALVTPDNVDDLLCGMGCPAEPDLGVIDIDGQDYAVWEGMKAIRPRGGWTNRQNRCPIRRWRD